MDKVIVTAFLVIAGVITAVAVFNTVYPAAIQSGDAMTQRGRRIEERLKSQIEIIHATADGSNALVWVKNLGSLRISAIEGCDVFFGPEGDFSRIPYGQGAGNPYWTWKVEDGSYWDPTMTLQITVINSSLLEGRYFIKVTAPNGVSDEYFFSE